MNSPVEHARSLLARARDDLFVVRSLRGLRDAPVWVLGFHAQQAVEKLLKAVLTHAGVEYPRTHNLVMLTELLDGTPHAKPGDSDQFDRLVPFAVFFRYEGAAGDEPPPIDPQWLDDVARRTEAWAAQIVGQVPS